MSVSWGSRTIPIEELMYDSRNKQPVAAGAWVYTGSTFVKDGDGRQRFAADIDGVLIGFMHSPSALIERVEGLVGYGGTASNAQLGLESGAVVTLTVRALSPAAAKR
jgi:hypothetical protein